MTYRARTESFVAVTMYCFKYIERAEVRPFCGRMSGIDIALVKVQSYHIIDCRTSKKTVETHCGRAHGLKARNDMSQWLQKMTKSQSQLDLCMNIHHGQHLLPLSLQIKRTAQRLL